MFSAYSCFLRSGQSGGLHRADSLLHLWRMEGDDPLPPLPGLQQMGVPGMLRVVFVYVCHVRRSAAALRPRGSRA